ncbi:hypothetical protein LCGC14_0528970 [marine sediment metagenome]|uniref:Uncharacterized protein n=1 Tax=marine sediment metagenome TaxID=412755 RepID=A0A0F9V465_9ZZZZ
MPDDLPAAYRILEVRRLSARQAWHEPSAKKERVDKAGAAIKDCIQRIGYAEALWVAEELAFEFGVWWDTEKTSLMISLSDLQLIAFASALLAHREIVYAQYTKRQGKKNGKKTKTSRPKNG